MWMVYARDTAKPRVRMAVITTTRFASGAWKSLEYRAAMPARRPPPPQTISPRIIATIDISNGSGVIVKGLLFRVLSP